MGYYFNTYRKPVGQYSVNKPAEQIPGNDLYFNHI